MASEFRHLLPLSCEAAVDVSASSISDASAAQLAMKVQVSVLNKSVDLQAQGALALLEALPAPVSNSNPPNLGNVIDVTA
ncbi:putative motility protein [Metapseudomonas otitidis]|uniref:putative motility protein n=1 Tax=Metapseudomonas otitidis TaxID=319939 RepID=UPI00197CF6C4|nr:YjfB family protein [Pseudomonas otitidis]